MRRILFVSLLPFAVSAFASAVPTNSPSSTNTTDTTQAVLLGGGILQGAGKSAWGGAALPLLDGPNPPTGSITCLANGNIAVDGVDQGGASICVGTTEISCTGGIHVIRGSNACAY